MLRAPMRGPQRRSIVSPRQAQGRLSRPTITGPRDAEDRTGWPSRMWPAFPCGPKRPAQNAMEVGGVPVACAAGNPQHARHRAPLRSQDGGDQQHLGGSQERWTKSGAKVITRTAKRAGRSGMAVCLGENAVGPAPSRASSTLPHPHPVGQSRALGRERRPESHRRFRAGVSAGSLPIGLRARFLWARFRTAKSPRRFRIGGFDCGCGGTQPPSDVRVDTEFFRDNKHLFAFRYEDGLRPYVEEVQDRAATKSMSLLIPSDQARLVGRVGRCAWAKPIYTAEVAPLDSVIMSRRFDNERPKRLSFQTISTSPDRRSPRPAYRLGRLSFEAEARSWWRWRSSTPVAASASRCRSTDWRSSEVEPRM